MSWDVAIDCRFFCWFWLRGWFYRRYTVGCNHAGLCLICEGNSCVDEIARVLLRLWCILIGALSSTICFLILLGWRGILVIAGILFLTGPERQVIVLSCKEVKTNQQSVIPLISKLPSSLFDFDFLRIVSYVVPHYWINQPVTTTVVFETAVKLVFWSYANKSLLIFYTRWCIDVTVSMSEENQKSHAQH